jgi:hypothetical protein
MNKEVLIQKMDYYTECADELINFGNSKEKAFGMGMKDIINIVKLYTNE